MSQKNETTVLALSLLITLGLVGVGTWWFAQRFFQGRNPLSAGNQTPALTSRSASLQDRISLGEKSLIPEPSSAAKQAGIAAIAAGNYTTAVQELETALQENRNDPETLIYLNNARIGDRPAYTVAIAAPIQSSMNPALELLRGVAQAQNDINQAGGIQGRPLRVMIADDGGEPETAKPLAEALVENPDVLGVIGHFSSSTSLAVAPIYDRGKLVMISPTSTSVQLSGRSPYVLRTVPSDRFAATALARYMLQTLNQQTAAIFFNSESDYSQSLKNEFATALLSDGGRVVAEFDLADPGFDPGAAVAQAKQLNAEVLMLAANTSTLDPALQVIAVNRQQLDLLGGDSLYNPKVLQVAGAAAEDMAVAVPWHVLSHSQAEFVQDSRRLWGGDVNWRTAMAYDAAQAFITGLAQQPDRQGLSEALHQAGFSATGATDPVQFLPSGDRYQAAQIVTVEPGNRSGYSYDFVPVP